MPIGGRVEFRDIVGSHKGETAWSQGLAFVSYQSDGFRA
jgi:hypothetical protein